MNYVLEVAERLLPMGRGDRNHSGFFQWICFRRRGSGIGAGNRCVKYLASAF